MKPAARVSDFHACPAVSPTPHVGGVVKGPGVNTVLIGHAHAATKDTACTCAAPVSNTIAGGSTTVKIGYKAAARKDDPTAHGGSILTGCPTVLIGG